MSDGTRCDGCFEMIDKEKTFAYIQVDLKTRSTESSYFDTLDSRHFHGHECLNNWVDKTQMFDGAFSDVEENITENGELIEAS